MVQLASIGVANEEHNRQALREMLFTAEGVETYISGVVRILSRSAIADCPSCLAIITSDENDEQVVVKAGFIVQ